MKNDELQHWGIKGMRWGVRRYQNKDGSLTSAGRKRQMSDDAKATRVLKKKKLSELSNAELRKLNERQSLERTYKQNNKSKIAIGLAATGTAISLLNKLGSMEDSISKIEKLSRRGKIVTQKATESFLRNPTGNKIASKGITILTNIKK